MTQASLFPGLGLFDVHSHLLPGVDDGCATLQESLHCAQRMAEAGYTHSFCTPHFWPNYPATTIESIPLWVANLQQHLDQAGVPLKLFPGSEINLREGLMQGDARRLPTFGMEGKFILCDMWADRLPAFFEPTIRWMQDAGLTVILAHPERMRAVQDEPELADYFAQLGVLLQGNLQCFSDRPDAATRRTVERFLAEDRYFLLGSDLHERTSINLRLRGLKRAAELAGEARVKLLTVDHPRTLIGKWE